MIENQTSDKARYCAAAIANYFLWKADQDRIEDMTPMKLMKLVYFAYAWYFAVFNKPLFQESIVAWKYGPVIPSIYHEFKRYGRKSISQFAVNFDPKTGEFSFPIVRNDDRTTLQVLEAVWSIYKRISGLDLSDITHEDKSPWKLAYEKGENTVLDNEKIVARAKEAIEKHLK